MLTPVAGLWLLSSPSQLVSGLVQLAKSIDRVLPMILSLIFVEENPKMSDYILSCCSTADMPVSPETIERIVELTRHALTE